MSLRMHFPFCFRSGLRLTERSTWAHPLVFSESIPELGVIWAEWLLSTGLMNNESSARCRKFSLSDSAATMHDFVCKSHGSSAGRGAVYALGFGLGCLRSALVLNQRIEYPQYAADCSFFALKAFQQ